MKELISSIQIVFPLLALVAVGVLLKKNSLISDKTISEMNKIVFSLFIPVNVFMSIYNSDFKTDFNLKFIIFLIFTVIIHAILAILLFKNIKDDRIRPAIIQASVRSNLAILGIPLAISVYGDKIAGIAAISVAFCTPLYNIFAILVFESLKKEKTSGKELLFKIFKNPIIIATLIAAIIKLVNTNLPVFAYDTINYLSKATTGISLLVLGASFNFKISSKKKLMIISLIFKMLIAPLISIVLAVMLGFRGIHLACVMCLFAQPVAISAYSFACGYDTDLKLISSIVVYSYVVALFSLPLWITVLKLLALI